MLKTFIILFSISISAYGARMGSFTQSFETVLNVESTCYSPQTFKMSKFDDIATQAKGEFSSFKVSIDPNCEKYGFDMRKSFYKMVGEVSSCSYYDPISKKDISFQDSKVGKEFFNLFTDKTANLSCSPPTTSSMYGKASVVEGEKVEVKTDKGYVEANNSQWPGFYLNVANKSNQVTFENSPTEVTATMFHELLHTLGYLHGSTMEVPYTCEMCCMWGHTMGEAQRVNACKLCFGEFEGKKYIEEYEKFYTDFKDVYNIQYSDPSKFVAAMMQVKNYDKEETSNVSLVSADLSYYIDQSVGAYPLARKLLKSQGHAKSAYGCIKDNSGDCTNSSIETKAYATFIKNCLPTESGMVIKDQVINLPSFKKINDEMGNLHGYKSFNSYFSQSKCNDFMNLDENDILDDGPTNEGSTAELYTYDQGSSIWQVARDIQSIDAHNIKEDQVGALALYLKHCSNNGEDVTQSIRPVNLKHFKIAYNQFDVKVYKTFGQYFKSGEGCRRP